MPNEFDILNDKALAVFDDRLPVVFKYNGETLRKLSALTKNVNNYETDINEVSYTSEYNRSLRGLGVSGATLQDGTPTPEAPIPIKNANDNGMNVVLHGKNLATAKQVYNTSSTVMKNGRECVKFTNNKTTAYRIEGGFKENTQYTISFDALSERNTNPSQGIGPMVFIVNYKGYSPNWNVDTIVISKYNEFYSKKFITKAGRTVDSIGTYGNTYSFDSYIDVNTFMVQEGAVTSPEYEPYFRETIEIPTSIDVDGTNVPWRFSEYDKLTVNRVKNEVKYLQGSVLKSFDGTENWVLNTFANSQTGKQYYMLYGAMPKTPTSNALCSHFIRRGWIFTNNNSFYLEGGANNIVFRTDGVQTRDEFKAFLQEQYANGIPVTVIAQRKTPDEYDITSTDLGISILDLTNKIPYGTIYLEINSGLTVPITVDYAKWGGADE